MHELGKKILHLPHLLRVARAGTDPLKHIAMISQLSPLELRKWAPASRVIWSSYLAGDKEIRGLLVNKICEQTYAGDQRVLLEMIWQSQVNNSNTPERSTESEFIFTELLDALMEKSKPHPILQRTLESELRIGEVIPGHLINGSVRNY